MFIKLYRAVFLSKYRFIWFTFIGAIAFFIMCAQVSFMGYKEYTSVLSSLSTFIAQYKLIFVVLHVAIIGGFYLFMDFVMDRAKAKGVTESRIKPFRQLLWFVCGLFLLLSIYLFVMLGW